MFFQNYMTLCMRKGVLPTVAAREVGLKASSYTGWSRGAMPRLSTLQKLADYFDVTVEQLLGDLPETETEIETEITQTKTPTVVSNGELSPNEIELIKLFRASSPSQREKAYVAALEILRSSLE